MSAATLLPVFFGGDFNKNVTDIVNSDIVGPPHFTGRVPYNFFVQKRKGLSSILEADVDKIFDSREIDGNWYILAKRGEEIVWMRNSVVLNAKPYSTDVNYKIIEIGAPSGSILETGTSGEGGITGSTLDEYLEDTSKSWSVDQFVNKWLYVYSASAGQGAVTQISYNTDNRLFSLTGFNQLPAGVTQYYIFDTYQTSFAYLMSDGIYISHGDTEASQKKILNTGDLPTDTCSVGARIFWRNAQGNIYVTNPGLNNLTLNITNFYVGTLKGVLDMVEYKDYVILLSNDRIDLVRSQDLLISTGTGDGSGSGSVQEIAFKIVNATKQFGEHNRGAYVIYNQGLYMVTGKGKFVTLSIQPAGGETGLPVIDSFTVNEQDQGVNIQRYLDPLVRTATYKISIDDNEINLVQNDPSMDFTRIFKYNFSYQGWHFWETEVSIDYIQSVDNDYYYIGSNIYIANRLNKTDILTTPYTQRVRFFLFEDSVFSVKNLVFLKVYVGHKTSRTCEVMLRYNITGHEHTTSIDLEKSEYLNQVGNIGLGGENSNPIYRYGSRGKSDEQISYITTSALIEIPLGINCDLIDLQFIAGGDDEIHIGGILMSYNLLDPQLTDQLNTI